MATPDRGIALGLGAVALAYLAVARRYPLDTLSAPGPGAFPLATGAALFLVAAWLFVTARPAPGAAAPTPMAVGTWSRVPVLLALALGLHAAALPWLGFIPASFLLVLAAARLMGLSGLWRPLALAAGLALVMRLVFVSGLGVPLP
jgi:putative tricarboxylic transport membrane protein